ncbi:fungal-specific transcription factor domain-containing protein [Aspergillus varians]
MTEREIKSSKSGRHVNAKVKSGCRTCKIRKVKCDESFPVCRRCLSTGRVCDGYGVWGGGGNHYWHRQSIDSPRGLLDPPQLARISTLVGSTDEMASFDWFRGRTIAKLPGSYRSDLWTKILLQLSHSEQAVWHAILALSSTHRVGFVDISSDPANKLEQSTLHHSIKAVHHLRPHFSARDKTSSRVVLIVCLMFIVLDLLRGHFASAQVHLRNGLSILTETQSVYDDKKCNPDHSFLPSNGSIDDSIGEVFFRLHTQVQFLQNMHRPRPCLLPPPLYPPLEEFPSTPQYSSYLAVWRGLDLIMNDIFRLSADAREHPTHVETLSTHQERIKKGLKTWLTTYNASLPTLQLSTFPAIAEARAKVHHIVLSYHTMLSIMTQTTIHPNETVFDNYTHHFTKLIHSLSETWNLSAQDIFYPSSQSSSTGPKRRWIGGCDMAHTIIDSGWMIPLFYVAIKCRHRSIRRQAIQLLESTNHREGIWDAKITACIGRRVMELEEGDFYDGLDDVDSTAILEMGCGSDKGGDSASMCSLELDPILPESSRIRDLEVRMEGNPLETVLLFGGWEGMAARVCIGEYHVPEQRWV